MKKIFFLLLAFLWNVQYAVFAADLKESLGSDELRDAIIPSNSAIWLKSSTNAESGTSFFDAILGTIRDGVFTIFALLVVAVFIYLGAKLFSARGNAEEFSKALKGFVYAAVGMFFVAIAWALVRFIAGLEIY